MAERINGPHLPSVKSAYRDTTPEMREDDANRLTMVALILAIGAGIWALSTAFGAVWPDSPVPPPEPPVPAACSEIEELEADVALAHEGELFIKYSRATNMPHSGPEFDHSTHSLRPVNPWVLEVRLQRLKKECHE